MGQNKGMKKTLLFALVPFLAGCGLIFVNGPAPGWQEIRDVGALERMAVSYPCTSDRTLVWLDGLIGVGQIVNLFAYETPHVSETSSTVLEEIEGGIARTFYGVVGLATGVGAIVGLNKTNDCRAFNAHLLEALRGNEQAEASYEWPDEFFPPPDLGVAAFDPVFGLPFNLADAN